MSLSAADAPDYPPVRYGGESGRCSARLRRGTAPPDLVSPATEIGYLATARLAFLRSHDQYDA